MEEEIQNKPTKKKRTLLSRLVRLFLTVCGVVVLCFLALCIYFAVRPSHSSSSGSQSSSTTAAPKTAETLINFEIADQAEPLGSDTYRVSGDRIYIYDNDYLNLLFDYEADSVTKELLYETIESNPAITEQFRKLFREFVDMAFTAYPGMDMRVLYENLKEIQVVEGDNELLLKSVSVDSMGCYRRDENIIYVKENYQFEAGTWEYQVIMHEIAHSARTYYRESGAKKVTSASTDYDCTILDEALNSLFTVHLFDYEERDIAYQLQSNYIQVMIDCMDNYDYGDYMQHSLTWFMQKLDEFNGDTNYAWTMIRLMEVQYNDYHDDDYELEQENYYPFYDYVAGMYYRAHVTDDMTEAERNAVVEELLDKILFDVPEEYHIDEAEFYRCMEEYAVSE